MWLAVLLPLIAVMVTGCAVPAVDVLSDERVNPVTAAPTLKAVLAAGGNGNLVGTVGPDRRRNGR